MSIGTLVERPAPRQIDGFEVHAPHLADGHDGFADDGHDRLDPVEDRHFWFRRRRSLIAHLIATRVPDATSFCEVGCGNGSVLAHLATTLPDLRLCGVDASLAGLRHARRRLPPGTRLLQADATDLPLTGEFDAAGVFDVLEHLDDDEAVLHSLHRALRPGGRLFITVPQHPWLWSWVDDASHHRRRYRRCELVARLRGAGFAVEHCTSYLVWLMPTLLLTRRRRPDDIQQALELSPLADRFCDLITGGELLLTRFGWDHRWGGSLVAVARRCD